MNPLPTILAFGQAIGFKAQALTDRYLQEAGVSPMGTFALQRYSLIPAVIWGLIFIRPDDISYIFHTPLLLFFILAIAALWNVQSFLTSYVLNTVSTVSALSTLEYLIYLPLLLLIGTYFNGDIPNAYSVAAIAVLSLAFVVQPAHHANNIRTRFSMPLIAIIGFVFLRVSLDAINNGMSREALGMISPQVFLGAFSITTMGLCAVWTSFMPRKYNDTRILKEKWWLAAAIPSLWFLASIPEAFAYAALPIYTVVSIGAITFAMDTLSDLFHKRTRLNARTTGFIALVLVGIGLAVYSV